MTEATKWKHKAVRAATLEELVVKLDEFGAEGWEVVNFYYGESLGDPNEKEFDGHCYKALMKRIDDGPPSKFKDSKPPGPWMEDENGNLFSPRNDV